MKRETKYKVLINTLFLYLRMFVTVVIGLYTSRVVLSVLGESDYGIFSLVGGIVLMLSFLNSGMLQASQRFQSFSLGEGNRDGINRTFWASWYAHLMLAGGVLIIGEILGLYMVNEVLRIPDDRIIATNLVLQCALLTSVVSILSVPYSSAIIAHEKMKSFAYISILEAMLKLGIVYLLMVVDMDHLIQYSILMLAVQVLIRAIYMIYCRHYFEECRSRRTCDRDITRRIIRFAGWSILGNLGIISRDQGTNMLLNIFYATPVINAARGIASNVNGVISGFATNITLALNPAITKEYAVGNNVQSQSLVMLGCRLSFYMLTLIIVPLAVNLQYFLTLWLGEVPEYTDLFLYFILGCSLIYALNQPITVAIQATGQVRDFQIGVFLLMITELVAVAVILWTTESLLWSLVPSLVIQVLAMCLRLVVIHRLEPGYRIGDYLKHIVVRCVGVFSLSIGCAVGLHRWLHADSLGILLGECALIVFCSVTIIILIGVSREEKHKLIAQLI